MLLVLFIVVPIVEIYFLIKLGGLIGGTNTILIIIATAICGAYLVKSEGRGILTKLSKGLSQGIEPTTLLLQGLCVFVGGLLLLTPGFLTDLVGFSVVFPYTRKFYINYLKHYFVTKTFGFYKAKRFSTTDEDDFVDTTGVEKTK